MRAGLRFGLLLALLGACASPRPAGLPRADAADYPGELRAAGALGAQVLWRQTVRARWQGGEESFDAVVQVYGSEFLVLGLSPLGPVGFALRYADGKISVENTSGRDLVVPARAVLLDVQRALFPWIEGALSPEGTRVAQRFGERIEERFVGGRLAERRFERLDGVPAGQVVVRYHWAPEDSGERLAPARLEVENGWFGYALEVRTHEEIRLEGSAGGPP